MSEYTELHVVGLYVETHRNTQIDLLRNRIQELLGVDSANHEATVPPFIETYMYMRVLCQYVYINDIVLIYTSCMSTALLLV